MSVNASHNVRLASTIANVRATLTGKRRISLDEAAILIVKLSDSGLMQYAGTNETKMYFSASLLKVSLLYASFELVARVNALAPSINASSSVDFFNKVEQAFAAKIAGSVPRITAGAWQTTDFEKALTAVPKGGKFEAQMSAQHRQDLASIFADQNQNVGARECMHRLGFSFVNGSLSAAGFFDVPTEAGVWMATDYIPDNQPGAGNWPSFNIPVVTNGTSSAATTALAMANLLTALHRKQLITPVASQEMRSIFAHGGSWLSTIPKTIPKSITDNGAKVGHSSSPSAKVGSVKSEAVFLKRKSDRSDFLVVWQNAPDALGPEPIYMIIDEMIRTWP
jgi:hypothetical protein